MRKLIIVGIATTLALAGATVAFGGGGEQRVVAKPKAASNSVQKPLAKGETRLAPSLARRVNCRTVGCVNRTLTKLKKNVKQLKRDAFQCEQLVDVTQYFGYIYSDGVNPAFPTTGLDYTATGDAVSDRFVVYTC